MKRYLHASIYVLVTVFFFASCTKQEAVLRDAITTDKTAATQGVADAVVSISGNSTYRITTFLDDHRNKTRQFKEYTFVFQTNGTIVAKNKRNGLPYYGSYFFDHEYEEVDIDFDTETKLDELRGDWDILEFDDQKIDLVDDDDRLIFTKIK